MRKKEEGRRTERGFRRLLAWQKADALASTIYRSLAKSKLPPWLASQTMRSAISVPANIAEGYGRGSIGDYIRFLDIARGSLSEVEYYLHFMRENEVLPPTVCDELDGLAMDAGNLLVALLRSLREKQKDGSWDRIAEEMPEYLLESEDLLPSSSDLRPGGEV